MGRSGDLPFHHGHNHSGHSHGMGMGMLSSGRIAQAVCRLPTLVCVMFLLAGLYAYALYSDASDTLVRAERRADTLAQSEDSLKAQLQVVYEHKTRLERNIEKLGAERDQEQAALHRQLTEKERSIAEITAERDSLRKENERILTDLDSLKGEQSNVQQDNQKIIANLTRSLEEIRTDSDRINVELEACRSSVRQLRDAAAASRQTAAAETPAPQLSDVNFVAAAATKRQAPASGKRRGRDPNIVEFVRHGPMGNLVEDGDNNDVEQRRDVRQEDDRDARAARPPQPPVSNQHWGYPIKTKAL